jgi:cytochrome c-type biogenesis protein CcmE
MKARHKRIALVVLGLCGLATAAGLAQRVQRDLVFFFSPSQVVAGEAPVAEASASAASSKGSLRHGADGLTA